jgi:hypothetical protein
MKDNKVLFPIATLLWLVVLVSAGCTWEVINPPEPAVVALRSFHGRYVTALGEEDHWRLTQEATLSECGQFIQHYLPNGKIALGTCYGRYVTASKDATFRWNSMLGQASKLGDWGQFDLYELGSDRVAFKTRDARFFTAGDGFWPGELAWSIVAETENLDDWETFTQLGPDSLPPFMVADFDDCQGTTNLGGLTGSVYDPNSNNRLEATFVPEADHGCVARLDYKMESGVGFWLQLQATDWSPYNQLVFDIKVDSPENAPQRARVELKRADGQEVSFKQLAGITANWQTIIVDLAEFEERLSSYTDIEELVFVFEANGLEEVGTIYLDEVALEQVWIGP